MPKNTKKVQGGNKKKLQLSNKQFDDLLKEIGGGLPEGLALDPTLLAALREATNEKFNQAAVEKFGEIPQDQSDEDDEEMEQQQEKAPEDQKKESAQEPETSSNNA